MFQFSSGSIDLEGSWLSVPKVITLPVLGCCGGRHWSDLSRGEARALVWKNWATQLPEPPSLSVLERSNGKVKPIQLVPDWLQVVPEGSVVHRS